MEKEIIAARILLFHEGASSNSAKSRAASIRIGTSEQDPSYRLVNLEAYLKEKNMDAAAVANAE